MDIVNKKERYYLLMQGGKIAVCDGYIIVNNGYKLGVHQGYNSNRWYISFIDNGFKAIENDFENIKEAFEAAKKYDTTQIEANKDKYTMWTEVLKRTINDIKAINPYILSYYIQSSGNGEEYDFGVYNYEENATIKTNRT